MNNKLTKQELYFLNDKICTVLNYLCNQYAKYIADEKTPPIDLINDRHILSIIYIKLRDQYKRLK